MSNDISAKRQQYTQDLNDLQKDYAKKRREIVNENEQGIAEMRERYENRINNERSKGEAAVNHIRKKTSENIESTSEEQERKVSQETRNYEKEVSSIRKKTRSLKEGFENKVELERETQDQGLQQVREQGERKRKAEDIRTREFLSSQVSARQKAEKMTNEGMHEVAQKGELEKKKAAEQYRNELERLNKQHREVITKQTMSRSEQIEQEKLRAQKEITDLTAKNKHFHETTRKEGIKEVQMLEQQLQTAKVQEKAEGEKNISMLKKENNDRVLQENKKTTQALEGVRQRSVQDMTKSEKLYQDRFEQAKKIQEQKVVVTTAEYEKQDAELKAKFDQALNKDHKQFEQTRAMNKKAYEETLARIKNENKTRFKIEEDLGKNELDNRQRVFSRALADQKLDHVQRLDKYVSTAGDPFYSIVDRGNSFHETENHYVLEAFIPAQDKDVVKVRIQPDKVTVSGSRKYQDKLEGDDRKLSSSNFQTFREEFKFSHPVLHDKVAQERDGDYVKFMIPKLSWLNKKA